MVLDVVDPALDADQAAIDAEFVAMVLVEAPWGESEAAPARTWRRTTTTTRLASAPWRPRGRRDVAGARRPRRADVRESRRRPGSVARSPPPSG
jgi:hypothetical protein